MASGGGADALDEPANLVGSYGTRLRDPELLKELQVFAMKENDSELTPA